MINRLFRQLISAAGVFFRVLRAFFVRQIVRIGGRIKQITNFSRKAASAVPKAVSSTAAAATKKPTRREDYLETKRLFISKSFVITAIIALLALGFIFYLIVWPWIVSTFLTAHIYIGDAKAETYTGKVILYHDETKTQPSFKGRLQGGLREGHGEDFDETGLLLFSGEHAKGLRQGKGLLFEGSALVYDGNFQDGVISGDGTQYDDFGIRYSGQFRDGEYNGQGALYKSGLMLYRGAFEFGQFNGEGSLYDIEGNTSYKGGFADGLQSGQGIEYHPNGKIKYKGSFLEGAYDDMGQLYNPDGSVKYDGSFRAGLYHGSGILTVDDGLIIEGKFESGKTQGEIEIYRNGRLHYIGTAENLIPHGYGTLYSPGTSEPVYKGMMKRGLIDGGWILGLTSDEARACFADASVYEERSGTDGFSIVNPQLGLSVFFTLRTEEREPTALRLYWYKKGADVFDENSWARTLSDRLSYGLSSESEIAVGGNSIMGVSPLDREKVYMSTAYALEGETIRYWRANTPDATPVLMVEWTEKTTVGGSGGGSGTGGAGSSGSGSGGGNPADVGGRTEALLNKLNLDSTGGNTAPDPSKYYGTGDPVDLLRALPSSEVSIVLQCMADYMQNAEKRESIEQRRAIIERQLGEAKADLQIGKGDKKRVDALTNEVEALNQQISKCVVGMEKARMTALDKTGGFLELVDLTRAIFIADPAGFDVVTLREAALGTTDLLSINLELMDIELAYQDLMSAIDSYKKSREEINRVYDSFETGKATRYDVDAAVIKSLEARSSLYIELTEYSKRMVRLNEMTGNWLALRYGFMKEIFLPMPIIDPENESEAEQAQTPPPVPDPVSTPSAEPTPLSPEPTPELTPPPILTPPPEQPESLTIVPVLE